MLFDNDEDCIIRQFWFDKRHNKFVDEWGDLILDIFYYITPFEYYSFIENPGYVCLKKGPTYYIELIYECCIEEEDEDLPNEYYL